MQFSADFRTSSGVFDINQIVAAQWILVIYQRCKGVSADANYPKTLCNSLN